MSSSPAPLHLVHSLDSLDGLDESAPSKQEFRAAMGHFATGVTVVTAARHGRVRGITANAVMSVSLDPLLVVVAVGRGGEMCGVLRTVGAYGISVLTAAQRDVAVRFADPRRPSGPGQFDGVDIWRAPVSGAPLITGAAAWLDCAVVRVIEAGDHAMFLGEVRAVGCAHGSPGPLLFHRGQLGPLDLAVPDVSPAGRPCSPPVPPAGADTL